MIDSSRYPVFFSRAPRKVVVDPYHTIYLLIPALLFHQSSFKIFNFISSHGYRDGFYLLRSGKDGYSLSRKKSFFLYYCISASFCPVLVCKCAIKKICTVSINYDVGYEITKHGRFHLIKIGTIGYPSTIVSCKAGKVAGDNEKTVESINDSTPSDYYPKTMKEGTSPSTVKSKSSGKML